MAGEIDIRTLQKKRKKKKLKKRSHEYIKTGKIKTKKRFSSEGLRQKRVEISSSSSESSSSSSEDEIAADDSDIQIIENEMSENEERETN